MEKEVKWHVVVKKEPAFGLRSYEIQDQDGFLIGSANTGMGDVIKNAQLLASAPTLLRENACLKESISEERCVIVTNRWTKTRRIYPVVFNQADAEKWIATQSVENSTYEIHTLQAIFSLTL